MFLNSSSTTQGMTKTEYFRNFQDKKVDLSEIKKGNNLVLLSRESKSINDNFIIDFPEARTYETYNEQDVPTELLLDSAPDFADQIPREINNEIFEQEQVDHEESEIKDFIRKPCKRRINKKKSALTQKS